MARLRKESPYSSDGAGVGSSSFAPPGYGQIDSVIVLDRQVDMITPLCTQLTYEGLIDECIGIKNSFISIDASLTAPPVPPTPSSSTATQFGAQHSAQKKKKHLLSTLSAGSSAQQGQNGADPLFADLRDRNFAVVGTYLNKIAKRINDNYEARHAAQTVGQMREFVGKLSGLQAEHQALRLRKSILAVSEHQTDYIMSRHRPYGTNYVYDRDGRVQ